MEKEKERNGVIETIWAKEGQKGGKERRPGRKKRNKERENR